MNTQDQTMPIEVSRLVRLFLALAFAALLTCAGCSSSGSSDDAAGPSSADAEETVEETEAEAEDEGLEQVAFEETVVVDNEYVTITLTSCAIESDSCTVGATLVNKSEDTDYTFTCNTYGNTKLCSVDGVQVTPEISRIWVSAGETAQSTITIDELQGTGVEFTDIYLSFNVVKKEDASAYVVEHEGVHIYPYGEEAATTFVRAAEETDTVLVDNDYLTVTVIGCDPDHNGLYAIKLYVENKTSSTMNLCTVDDVYVNDIECISYGTNLIGSGLNSYQYILLYDSTLESAGIEKDEIEKIEFTLMVYDYDTFSHYVDNQVFTLNIDDLVATLQS